MYSMPVQNLTKIQLFQNTNWDIYSESISKTESKLKSQAHKLFLFDFERMSKQISIKLMFQTLNQHIVP